MEFNQWEQESSARQRAVQANLKDDQYAVGWNAGLELAACRIEHDFVKAFGKDTLSSIAIYIRGMKK
jgi:hypothetical protein